jgi:hypothetical protein
MHRLASRSLDTGTTSSLWTDRVWHLFSRASVVALTALAFSA